MSQYTDIFPDYEILLLKLLKYSINIDIPPEILLEPADRKQYFDSIISSHFEKNELDNADWKTVVNMADRHSVLPLLYDTMSSISSLPKPIFNMTANKTKQTVLQNYRLLALSDRLISQLDNSGIHAVLLKGWQTAVAYPVPETRKSGDIDILIADNKEFIRAVSTFKQLGYKKAINQLTIHHIEFKTESGISIELHSMLSEPFENELINKHINDILPEYSCNITHHEILGYTIACTDESHDAFYLLLHMLQHFLRAGFGLKLLCDWCVFWKRDIDKEQKTEFLRLIRHCRMENFAKAITRLCIIYLGLSFEKVEFLFKEDDKTLILSPKYQNIEGLMKDILEAEEFGHSSSDRMVLLHGSRPSDYFREFHHQMKLSHKRASKYIILWPCLWLHTLIVFLHNNKRIRKTTAKEIFKKAGTRSRIIKEIKLFER